MNTWQNGPGPCAIGRSGVPNTGVDDWDEIPTSLEYDKSTPELSDVRIVAKAAADRCPGGTTIQGGNRQKLPGHGSLKAETSLDASCGV